MNSLTYNQHLWGLFSVDHNWNYGCTAVFASDADVNNLLMPWENNGFLCVVSPCITEISHFTAGFNSVFSVLSVQLPCCWHSDYRLSLKHNIYQNSISSRFHFDVFFLVSCSVCVRMSASPDSWAASECSCQVFVLSLFLEIVGYLF